MWGGVKKRQVGLEQSFSEPEEEVEEDGEGEGEMVNPSFPCNLTKTPQIFLMHINEPHQSLLSAAFSMSRGREEEEDRANLYKFPPCTYYSSTRYYLGTNRCVLDGSKVKTPEAGSLREQI